MPSLQYHHLIGVLQGRQAVADGHQSQVAMQLLDGHAHPGLVLAVQGAGGLVQDQQAGLAQQGASARRWRR